MFDKDTLFRVSAIRERTGNMKMWTKRLVRAAVTAGICLLLILLLNREGGRKETEEAAGEVSRPVRIGFSEIDSSNPWRVAQQTSLINAAADRGFTFLFEEPKERTVQWQLQNIREMLDEGIDYLIVIPASETALGEIIEMLKETDTKLILMECSTWDVDEDDYLFMIRTDYYKEGQLCAQILHSCYHEGMVSILEVTGEEDSSVAKQRSEGFRDEILKYPHMKISGQIVGSFDRVTAQKSMEEMLAGEPYYYNAIVAYSDEDGLGVLQALKVAGKADGSVPIISINGVQDALKAIIAGEYYATVESSPEVGPLIMQLIGSNEKGYAPAKQIFIPYNIFDRENVLEQYKNAY